MSRACNCAPGHVRTPAGRVGLKLPGSTWELCEKPQPLCPTGGCAHSLELHDQHGCTVDVSNDGRAYVRCHSSCQPRVVDCPDACVCHAYMPTGRVCSWCQQEGHEDR